MPPLDSRPAAPRLPQVLSAAVGAIGQATAEGSGELIARWARPAVFAAGSLVAIDGLAHLLEPSSGLLLGAGALAGGVWLLAGRRLPPAFHAPADLQGWIQRCEGLLPQFERLGADPVRLDARRAALEGLALERAVPQPQVALAGVETPSSDLAQSLVASLRGARGLQLRLGQPLASAAEGWIWPDGLAAADVLLFSIRPPLRASELRWLEALPPGQPVWLLLQSLDEAGAAAICGEILTQWPAADPTRLLVWNGESDSLASSLEPLATWLHREAPLLRARTGRRRLEDLHRLWQAELEGLRRLEWQRLLLRTQWTVAAGVLLAPLPSLDLLVLAVANGLMLKEMATLWECPWSVEQLRGAASELARAALAQGVIEWSTQALASAVRLHGATWLVGGALQALSAAYLTRVVGRAMADTLALTAGVAEPDLVRIRQEAPLLVARAAEQERLDWAEFLRQGRRWWSEQSQAMAG